MNHKWYVKVRADFCLDGRIVPLKFRTEEGQPVIIDKILDVRPAASLKAGGRGMRYTCRVGDRQVYLFHDHEHWFLEV